MSPPIEQTRRSSASRSRVASDRAASRSAVRRVTSATRRSTRSTSAHRSALIGPSPGAGLHGGGAQRRDGGAARGRGWRPATTPRRRQGSVPREASRGRRPPPRGRRRSWGAPHQTNQPLNGDTERPLGFKDGGHIGALDGGQHVLATQTGAAPSPAQGDPALGPQELGGVGAGHPVGAPPGAADRAGERGP